MEVYNFKSIEKKWQNIFEEKKYSKPKIITKKNFTA